MWSFDSFFGLKTRNSPFSYTEGEKSSKYFCNLEKRSSDKKNIYRLKRNDDSIISCNVMNEIHFFSALFITPGRQMLGLLLMNFSMIFM